jgi:Domain of unknown function (DUF5753)
VSKAAPNKEASASAIRACEHVVIHGLLQTEEYAAWVIREFLGELYASQQTDRRVELRMKRQELLTRPRPPELAILHDEATLRRIVGSPAVMRRQLQHLADLAERPNVILNVLPFAAGVREGSARPRDPGFPRHRRSCPVS